MTSIFGIVLKYSPFIVYPFFAFFLFIVFYFLYLFTKRCLYRWAKRTENKFDDIVVKYVCRYYWYIAVFVAIFLFSVAFPISAYYREILDKVVSAGFVILGLLFGEKLLFSWLEQKAQQKPEVIKTLSPIKNVIRIVFLIVGVLLVLDNLGFSLTAVWTTLGIGSFAVALAFKDTIANFFSGIYILLDKIVLPDEYIKLSSGEEGTVIEIGWRSTRIYTIQNNIVIIPNSKLVESIITNYSRPDSSLSVQVQVSVAYKYDPNTIEQILFDEVSKAVKEIDGAVADFTPIVRFMPGMSEYGLTFSIFVRAKGFTEQYYLRHEIQKRIFLRLKKENIEIPYPTRVVHISQQ